MSDIEHFERFQSILELFERYIESKDSSQINDIFELIKENENLFLESYTKRKKEGVYYTNEEIADFIIKQVILTIINKRIENIDYSLKNIEELNSIYQFPAEIKKKVHDLLIKLKICDPTCGSGVFLLSAAEILFNLIKGFGIEKDFNSLKIKIIQNLYGLDINTHAINLCTLKFLAWLHSENINDYFCSLSSIRSNLKIANSIITPKWTRKLFNILYFDIIVGNPPYGNILSKKEKDILKKEGNFYTDIYCAFLLKALDWINDGVIGFLVPKSFLLRQGYTNFRNKLLTQGNFLKIFDFGPNLFKKATNEVQVVIYNKDSSKKNKLKIYDYPNHKIIEYIDNQFDSLNICLNNDCPLCDISKKLYVYTYNNTCPYCASNTLKLHRIRIKPSSQIFDLMCKIERTGDLNYLNNRDFPKMIRGEEAKGLIFVKKNLLKSPGSCFFINAKDDFKYYYLNKKKSFEITNIHPAHLKGKNYEYYISPKLLIKHNNIIPEAIFTKEKTCFTSSIYSLLHDDLNELKYLCALLNSAVIQLYCIYAINNQKGTTINLNQYMIRHLPLIKPSDSVKNEVANKVDSIINEFEKNNGKLSSENRQLLQEIDDIIFNLYSITKEEREIILSSIISQITYFKNLYDK